MQHKGSFKQSAIIAMVCADYRKFATTFALTVSSKFLIRHFFCIQAQKDAFYDGENFFFSGSYYKRNPEKFFWQSMELWGGCSI